MLAQQAVLLVGGLSNKLFPLTSPSTPKALLNVGNQPLISFPVKLLEEGGIKEIFLVRLCSLQDRQGTLMHGKQISPHAIDKALHADLSRRVHRLQNPRLGQKLCRECPS